MCTRLHDPEIVYSSPATRDPRGRAASRPGAGRVCPASHPGVGAIRDGRPAAEIVRALVQEAEEALDRVAVLRRSGVSSDTGGKARPGRVMATPMHLVEGREKDATMPLWKADLTFYPSPRAAPQAPRETLAYVLTLNPADDGKPDALCVVDVDPDSAAYGQVVCRLEMPNAGDELHHFGWNACRPARTAPRRGLFTT